MKADYMERIALGTGWLGYCFTILCSGFVGAWGGVIIGVFAGGMVSGVRNVELEDDPIGGWVIVVFALLGAIFTGSWCRRRLIKLRYETQTEQEAAPSGGGKSSD